MKFMVHRILFSTVATVGLVPLQIGRAAEPSLPQGFNTAEAETLSILSRALTLHVSFDEGLDADFAHGDKTCYVLKGKELVKAAPTDDVRLAPEAGRFGGSVHFTKKSDFCPVFKNEGVLDYNDKNWNASVARWLRLNPDEDLEPGYCDPVQIVGDDSKKGFIFLEWSKDETPRFFRYLPVHNPLHNSKQRARFSKSLRANRLRSSRIIRWGAYG